MRFLLLRVAAATWSACAEWRGIARRIDTVCSRDEPRLPPTGHSYIMW